MLQRLRIPMALLPVLLGAAGAAANTWQNVGPVNEAGVIRGLQLHASNRLFGASPDGGLWLSDLGAASPSWTPISDQLDNIEIRAFGVSRVNDSVIYVANKSFSLYRTTDRGASWTKLTSFNKSFGRVNTVLVPYKDPGVVFLGTTTGLYKSTDSGASWNRMIPDEDVLDLAADKDSSLILYVGLRKRGVYKTTNGGSFTGQLTWTAAWTLIRAWSATIVVDYQTNDVPPRTFNPPRIRPSQMIKIALGETRHDGTPETPATRTVAVKIGRSVFVSTNGGSTFQDRSAAAINANDAGFYTRTESFVDDEWCNAIAVDPFDSDRILVGQTALFVTTNRGTSWTEVTDKVHEDIQAIQFSRTVRNLVYVANDGGVEKSTAATLDFSRFYTGLITSQLMRAGIAGDVVVANSDHNGIVGTDALSASQGWRNVVTSTCGYANNSMERMGVYNDRKRRDRFYFFHDSHIGRVTYPYTSGTNCQNNAAAFSDFVPHAVKPHPEYAQQGIAADTRSGSQLILAAGDYTNRSASCIGECLPPAGTVYDLKLTRNGDREPIGDFPNSANLPTWEVAAQSTDDPFVSVAFFPRDNGKNAYAITEKGALYTAAIPLPVPAKFPWTRRAGWVGLGAEGVRHFALSLDENRVYAITGDAFARTTDAGQTWTVRPHPIPAARYYSIYLRTEIPGGTKIYVATSEGVYLSYDDGATWSKMAGLPNVKVTQLLSDNIFLYAVTFGRGLWRLSMVQPMFSKAAPSESETAPRVWVQSGSEEEEEEEEAGEMEREEELEVEMDEPVDADRRDRRDRPAEPR